MPQAQVAMDVRKAGEGTSVVDVRGELTAFAEGVLMEAYNQAGDARCIIFNFEGLQYMNSSGIGLLVTLLVRAKRQRQSIMAFGLNDHYRQIFELTRLDDAIGIYDTEPDALAAAGA